MPPTRKRSGGSSGSKKDEVQQSKSPAEFFAENQSIAGFDNAGKSLYTTLRELIENSLDACESVNVLPDISVKIEEMTEAQFNKSRGVPNSQEEKRDAEIEKKKRAGGDAYFTVTVRDNGCGMAHDAIPDLLGRVLSGSKYGVRQTRGKFGLGAKMALIWSKKSTGVPIRVKSSHVKGVRGGGGGNLLDDEGTRKIGPKPSDIYKNCPRVLEHKQKTNSDEWIGTEIQVQVAGNWTTYKSRVVQYLHQLAIITPYARLEMAYTNQTDAKKNFDLNFDRRSDNMPAQAREVKHHPTSVNNLLIQQLLERTNSKSLLKFLTNDLSGITSSAAKKLIERLGDSFDADMSPEELDDKQITRLVQVLRKTDDLFKNPDGGCLSPLGEYNLNLGIQKVIEPDVIATAREKPGSYDGHPFIVEAAVSLGGNNAKEGITVVRFANRIPLLFETGADVATRVANSKIKWSSYKIDHKREKITVFVSIVSTKVPFKGTGKEYIGDDIVPIQASVKKALQTCCQQLRAHLAKRNALRDVKERKSKLLKYIPDVSRSLFGILDGMRKRKLDEADGLERLASPRKRDQLLSPASKRLRVTKSEVDAVVKGLEKGKLSEEAIKRHLTQAVEENANTGAFDDQSGNKSKSSRDEEERLPLFIIPIYDKPTKVIRHPLFDFYPTNHKA
ncbi:hypothetical protein THAOC_30957 [Thalassiosira oceanica]|uniref:DNA topoisomerase VI subunit B transducer domain-containing protein n=1 Tax=Thalassiosira oceanica TaxID=159749 RepID=K0RAA8_THAOC|nr:hypothetical protein THAOC_30957 [Thalassiosira oceanica]|eukprot:EJK50110.1 hypothetical protein THAOC_30957 [Thalassiosira oceanica]